MYDISWHSDIASFYNCSSLASWMFHFNLCLVFFFHPFFLFSWCRNR
jgi:hypothetical protein